MVMATNDTEKFVEIPDESAFEQFSFFDNGEISDKFRNFFGSVSSLTSKEDLLLKLRYQLLAEIAAKLGCSKVLLGDTETRIAVRVLADIALGKGGELAQNCGFADDRHEDVILIRPMRELLVKRSSLLCECSQAGNRFQSTAGDKAC